MKKRIFSILTALALCLTMLPTAAWAEEPDEVSDEEPGADGVYEISTAAELVWFANEVNSGNTSISGRLVDDIDLSTVCGEGLGADNADVSWTPIGKYIGNYAANVPFQGTFDGQGHTVSNLYINIECTDVVSAGLFGYVGRGGTVKNLAVSGEVTVPVTSGADTFVDVGGVVGDNSGTAENCSFSGTVKVTGIVKGSVYAGGVFGDSSDTVTNCSFNGTVTVEAASNHERVEVEAGGVVGWNAGTVTNCYSTGTVKGVSTSTVAGGVAGLNNGTVTNCYNTGSVTATGTEESYPGGVVGYNNDTVTGCYYLTGTASQSVGYSDSKYGFNDSTDKDSAAFASGEVAYLLSLDADGNQDPDSPWRQNLAIYLPEGSTAADTYPILDSTHLRVTTTSSGSYTNTLEEAAGEDGYYEIYSAAQLYAFANAVNSGQTSINAKLMDDIDLSSVCGQNIGSWTPIGTSSNSFQGTFDGQGHTVKGLYMNITRTGNYSTYGGLFGNVEGGTVKNLNVNGTVTVTNKDSTYVYVGGVIGYAGYASGALTTVENCSFAGEVTGTSGYSIYVGGVVGPADKATVRGCFNSGTVTVNGKDYSYAGGVVGRAYGGTTVENCYNTGAVTGTGSDIFYVGGVAGYIYLTTTMKNCYNTGTVSGPSGGNVGGVVGGAGYAANYPSTVENCYFLQATDTNAGLSGIGYDETSSTSGESSNDGATPKTEDEFASGEVAHLLQAGQATQYWGQTLGEDEVTYPVLTSDEDLSVVKVTFMVKAGDGYTEHAAKYTNTGGTVTLPDTPTSDAYVFLRWSQSTDANGEEFTDTTTVTKSITVYAVGRERFGGETEPIAVSARAYLTTTVDLSEYMAYAGETGSAGKFTYTITGEYNSEYFSIDGDNLIIKATEAGTYTLTITAKEINQQISLFSISSYDTSDVTFTVKVVVAKADPEVTAPAANTLTYTGEAQALVTAGSTTGGTLVYSTERNGTYSETIPTGTNAGTYTVYYKVEGNDNYNGVDADSVTVTVKKATPDALATPTVEPVTYGVKLSDIVLATGWSWSDGNTVPTVKNEGYPAAYTVTDDTNYDWSNVNGYDSGTHTVTRTVTVTVNRAASSISAKPTAKTGLVYTGLQQELVNAGSGVVGGTLEYSTDGTSYSTEIPTGKDAGDYTVWYKVEGDDNHNDTAADSVTVTIAKAAPTYALPTGLTAVYGQTLADVKFDAAGWAWNDSALSVGDVGEHTFSATYTPEDVNNYNEVTVTVTVTVTPAASKVDTAPTAIENIVYTGSAQELVTGGNATGGELVYSTEENGEYSATIPTGTKAGTYNVWYMVKGDDNHNDTTAASVTVTIAKAEPEYIAPTAKELTYTGEAQALVSAGSTEHGTIQYSTDGTNYSTDIPTGTSAGEYTVYYKVVGDGNHNDTTAANVTVTIAKAAPTYRAPAANTLTYTGEAQALVTAGSTADGELVYSLTADGNYTDSVPTSTNADTYTVWYMVKGDDNHTNTTAESVEVTIAKAEPDVEAPTGLTAVYGQTLAGVKLPSGWAWADGTLSADNERAFEASYTPSNTDNYSTVTVDITVTIVAEVDVGPGETVEIGDTTVTNNDDGTVTVTGEDGTEITVTLPEGSDSVTVDGDGNVTVPDGTTVKAGNTEITLPSGGTIDGDGNVTGEAVQIGDTTITAPEGETVTTMPDGTTTAPSGTTVQTGDGPIITLPDGGEVTDDGSVTAGTVQVGDTTITAPEGETVTTTPDGTTAAPGGTTVEVGDTTITIGEDTTGATVDENGSINLPSGGTVTLETGDGKTVTIEVPKDGTVSVGGGKIVLPGGSTVTVGDYTTTIPAAGGNLDVSTGAVTINSSGKPGSGSSTPTYTPTVKQTDNGAVTVSPKSPKQGATVTIIPKPDTGYEVDTVTVTGQNGKTVKVTDNGDGTYSFTQPAYRVTVEVTFTEIQKPVEKLPFTDVPESAYYYDAVKWAVENGVTAGTTATTFSPDAPCTRAQAVTFLWRAAGSPEPVSADCPFTDLQPGDYYYKAVLWAVENGITMGTSSTTFGPDVTCSRAQIVTFLYRAKGTATADSNPFADVSDSAYYTDAVKWAVTEGVTAGTSATTFSPDNDCTRAQIVTFLYRAYA